MARAGRFSNTIEAATDALSTSPAMGDPTLARYVGEKTRKAQQRRAADRNIAIQSRLDTQARITGEHGAAHAALMSRYNALNATYLKVAAKNKQFINKRYNPFMSRWNPAYKTYTKFQKQFKQQGDDFAWKNQKQHDRYVAAEQFVTTKHKRHSQLGKRLQGKTARAEEADRNRQAALRRANAAARRSQQAAKKQKRLNKRFT